MLFACFKRCSSLCISGCPGTPGSSCFLLPSAGILSTNHHCPPPFLVNTIPSLISKDCSHPSKLHCQGCSGFSINIATNSTCHESRGWRVSLTQRNRHSSSYLCPENTVFFGPVTKPARSVSPSLSKQISTRSLELLQHLGYDLTKGLRECRRRL